MLLISRSPYSIQRSYRILGIRGSNYLRVYLGRKHRPPNAVRIVQKKKKRLTVLLTSAYMSVPPFTLASATMQIFSGGFLHTIKIVVEFVFVFGLLPHIVLVIFRFVGLSDCLFVIFEPTLLLSNKRDPGLAAVGTMRFSTVEAPVVSIVMSIPLSNHENIGKLMMPLFFKVCFHSISF